MKRERETERRWDGSYGGPQQHLRKTGVSGEEFRMLLGVLRGTMRDEMR